MCTCVSFPGGCRRDLPKWSCVIVKSKINGRGGRQLSCRMNLIRMNLIGESKGEGNGELGRQGVRENMLIYYEQQIKRELKGIHICGCQCNERLKAKTDGSV